MGGHDHHRPRSRGSNGNHSGKRKHESERFDGMGHTLSLLRQQPELEEFNLTSTRRSAQDEGSNNEEKFSEAQDSEGWQTIEDGRPKKKAKKIPKADSSNYPTIKFSSDSRLQSQIKLSDIQNLILYILADGPSPQFVSIKHRPEIRKVVVLMIPGLEKSMFFDEKKRVEDERLLSPDDYYPVRLIGEELPAGLDVFANMFEDLWPVKTPGDDKYGKMHSPLHAILTAPMPKDKEERNSKKNKRGGGVQPAREPVGWRDSRTPIAEFVHSPEELLENDYTLHPAVYDDEVDKNSLSAHRNFTGVSQDHGWVDTLVERFQDGFALDNEIEQGSLTGGREILAMDCEMCMTGESEFSLTRISIVSWDGSVILDELVKPAKPITNYVTQYSGITEKMLENVTTTLQDIQERLIEILHPRTILIGHSLNSDLTALKLTHPFIIDTAIIYPHPRGPPLKSSLKWLAQKYLHREIQKGHGTNGPGAGHDSIEDARTCLDLVKQKCEKGKEWGTSDAVGENIFKRISRSGVKYKNQGGSAIPSPINARSSAMVDWGDPKKGSGAAATYIIGSTSDEEVVKGVIRAINGDPDGREIPGGGVDFVFGRLRELEAVKGWWNNNKNIVQRGTAVAVEAVPTTTCITTKAGHHIVQGNTVIEKTAEGPANDEQIVAEIADQMATAVAKPNFDEIPGPVRESVSDNSSSKARTDADEVARLHPIETHILGTRSKRCLSQTTSPLAPNSSIPPRFSIPELNHVSPDTAVSTATTNLVTRLQNIYTSLPPCTAFIIYSGSGDPREMSRLQNMQMQFKREYKVKKWDQLSVKWTDTEEQALKRAVRQARNGIAFVSVK